MTTPAVPRVAVAEPDPRTPGACPGRHGNTPL